MKYRLYAWKFEMIDHQTVGTLSYQFSILFEYAVMERTQICLFTDETEVFTGYICTFNRVQFCLEKKAADRCKGSKLCAFTYSVVCQYILDCDWICIYWGSSPPVACKISLSAVENRKLLT